MAKSYTTFKDFFQSKDIELHREVEIAVHNDKNIANNRLFVWTFEEADLKEFLEFFQLYKDSGINITSRQILSGNLMRKMNGMHKEGYNPVECMLYASKTINMKLLNDKELQEILAERIKDIYIKQESETAAVLENIINMWTWVPQVKTVITAVGLIGDNQGLLDKIMSHYSEDPNYKTKVFYALMQNKSINNLERVLKIIMNLQDTEEDNILGRAFVKDISGFGYEGTKIIAKYFENPAITRMGSRIIKKIMLTDSSFSQENQRDDLYRKNLASKSGKDDLAYKDFLQDCYDKYDNDAFYLSRFSRPDIGGFLKSAIEDENLSPKDRNTAIISLGIIGQKGYSPANSIINSCVHSVDHDNAIMIANILLNKADAVQKLVDMFCENKDYELSALYGVLRAANITNFRSSLHLIELAFEKKFRELLESGEYDQLDCLTLNIQMFWEKKLYSFLSKDLLNQMQEVLMVYAQNTIPVPKNIIISIIETIVHSWNPGVEKAIFILYKQSDNQRVQEVSFKKLKERKIEAPK